MLDRDDPDDIEEKQALERFERRYKPPSGKLLEELRKRWPGRSDEVIVEYHRELVRFVFQTRYWYETSFDALSRAEQDEELTVLTLEHRHRRWWEGLSEKQRRTVPHRHSWTVWKDGECRSTPHQEQDNLESRRRQYALADYARGLGFASVEVIDDDLGISGSGTVSRPGFDRLFASLATRRATFRTSRSRQSPRRPGARAAVE